jgi:CheY-like chemotaxis protein
MTERADAVPIRILMVEDQQDNTTIYRLMLEHAGYTVLHAWDGAEGLRLAREALPELILMDISVPLVDGWEATRQLKADPATAAIRVVALTAHAFPEDRERAAAIGFDAYLAKPVEPTRVLAVVRELLAVAAPEA